MTVQYNDSFKQFLSEAPGLSGPPNNPFVTSTELQQSQDPNSVGHRVATITKDEKRLELDPDLQDDAKQDVHRGQRGEVLKSLTNALIDTLTFFDQNGSKDLEYGDLAKQVKALKDLIQNKIDSDIPHSKDGPPGQSGGETQGIAT